MGVERVLIRRIVPDEIDVFRRIRLEALRCEPASFASRFEDWVMLPDEAWRQRLNDPVFVAFSKSEPIGIMGLLRFRPRKMAHRATLVMVYLRECFRSTGLAKDLLDAVIDFARGEGVLQLELAVNAENPAALRFYRRHGFIEVGRIPCGLLDGDREIVDVIMVRRLSG
ncbi:MULTISPECIES: GNAT family N-acetyltransferase [Rhizobium]|jgi:GNAT superfamily N-acetyltransferase|nr:GNAT family N-acetyltransferase [Rhizobium lusitanum]